MILTENGCVDCGKPCLGISCPHRYVHYLSCDKCHEIEDALYNLDGEHLCSDCLVGEFEKVTLENTPMEGAM